MGRALRKVLNYSPRDNDTIASVAKVFKFEDDEVVFEESENIIETRFDRAKFFRESS